MALSKKYSLDNIFSLSVLVSRCIRINMCKSSSFIFIVVLYSIG